MNGLYYSYTYCTVFEFSKYGITIEFAGKETFLAFGTVDADKKLWIEHAKKHSMKLV